MLVKQIKYNSKEYKEMVRLRNLILRQPLGLSYNKLDLLKEKDDMHIGCFNKNKIIGTLLMGLSVLVIIAMIVNNLIFWFIVDSLVILLCGISGVILIKQDK